MNNLMKILIFISIFTMLIVFTGTVSATNEIVNPENSIQFINDTYDDDNVTTGNNITDNQISDELTVNTTGIVMSNTIFNCGPASLATVLQNLSINVSQDVLAAIAGTDDNGATMYGLAQAAQNQGVIAKGIKLTVNELKPWNIVYLIIEGEKHYSITTSITDTTVYLADSDSGNINMTLADFTTAYVQNMTNSCGYALVITNNSADPQLCNNNTLTDDEMESIKGTGYSEWSPNNIYIKTIALYILNHYRHDRRSLGLGIWNYITNHIHYHSHIGTIHGVGATLNIFHAANCTEMARLVVCIARAMHIPYYNVRYVNKPQGYYYDYHHGQKSYPGHWWAQIQLENGYWQDIDCTCLYDGAQYYGGFMDNYIGYPYNRVRFNGIKLPWRDYYWECWA